MVGDQNMVNQKAVDTKLVNHRRGGRRKVHIVFDLVNELQNAMLITQKLIYLL